LGLKGVLVISVAKGSPAEAAGLRGLSRTPDGIALGDIVVGIGATPVNDYDDFYNTLDEHHAGEEVDVKLLRAGRVVTVRLPLVAVQ
jgi:S1-C subfamily serine protease